MDARTTALVAVYALAGTATFVVLATRGKVTASLSEFIVCVIAWPVVLFGSGGGSPSANEAGSDSSLDEPPQCSEVIVYEGYDRFGKPLAGRLTARAQHAEEVVMERFLEFPELAADGSEDHRFFKWVRRRASGREEAVPLPAIFRERFPFTVTALIDGGRADVYCMECETGVRKPAKNPNALGAKGGWMMDTYTCPRGHTLFACAVAHVSLAPRDRPSAERSKSRQGENGTSVGAVKRSDKRNAELSPLALRMAKQIIGGQSVLFQIFTQALRCEPAKVRKIELTYFALATLSYLTSRDGGGTAANAMSEASVEVWARSLLSCGESLSPDQALGEYDGRSREYFGIFNAIVPPGPLNADRLNPQPCTALLLHLYEQVMGTSAEDAMLYICGASPLIFQFIDDNIDFLRVLKA